MSGPRSLQKPREAQTTDRVVMVRPVRFTSNSETAPTNAFQSGAGLAAASSGAARHQGQRQSEYQAEALKEFDAFVEVLRAAGVVVHVHDDTPEPHTPDSIFPNNWVSLHATGQVVLYPMLASNRRAEVRRDLLQAIEADAQTSWPRVEDLTGLQAQSAYLEGTGSLVLDRVHHVAYACLSPRTTEPGLAAFAQAMRYELVVFRAMDPGGVPIYHTNVVMGVGPDYALVCLESIPDAGERQAVEVRLTQTGHELIPITSEQMANFAGNFLALQSTSGKPLIVLSERALFCLTSDQKRRLERHGSFVHSPFNTIEDIGGGSARCMLLEVHVPV